MESLQTRVLVQLRDLILKGEFSPGERLTEIPLADKLKASRTPVRAALAALESEGLVEALASGGYVMRQITPAEIDDAICVRGHLEGMAARLIAERGMSSPVLSELKECLRDGDAVIEKNTLTIDDYTAYTQMNDRFHDLVIRGTGNGALARAIDQVNRLPFAAASALVPSPAAIEQGKKWLMIAHYQHHELVKAMEHRQGTRAQALAEEHVNISRQNLQLVLARPESAAKFMPAIVLVAGRR